MFAGARFPPASALTQPSGRTASAGGWAAFGAGSTLAGFWPSDQPRRAARVTTVAANRAAIFQRCSASGARNMIDSQKDRVNQGRVESVYRRRTLPPAERFAF